jgi:ABC-type ATPase with predicted acetyltransferase domain
MVRNLTFSMTGNCLTSNIAQTFLNDPVWTTRTHIHPDAELVYVYPHWHDTHEEVFRVVSGRMEYTLDGVKKVYGPDDGLIHIPKRTVHSIRSFVGEESIVDEGVLPHVSYNVSDCACSVSNRLSGWFQGVVYPKHVC